MPLCQTVVLFVEQALQVGRELYLLVKAMFVNIGVQGIDSSTDVRVAHVSVHGVAAHQVFAAMADALGKLTQQRCFAVLVFLVFHEVVVWTLEDKRCMFHVQVKVCTYYVFNHRRNARVERHKVVIAVRIVDAVPYMSLRNLDAFPQARRQVQVICTDAEVGLATAVPARYRLSNTRIVQQNLDVLVRRAINQQCIAHQVVADDLGVPPVVQQLLYLRFVLWVLVNQEPQRYLVRRVQREILLRFLCRPNFRTAKQVQVVEVG